MDIQSQKTSQLHERRGFIEISKKYLGKWPESLFAVFEKFIPVGIYHQSDALVYEGYSPLFEKASMDEKPPKYLPIMKKRKDGSFVLIEMKKG